MKVSLLCPLLALSFLTACTSSRFEGSSPSAALERPAPVTPPNMYQSNPKADLEDPTPRPTTPVNPVNPIRSEALPDASKPLTPVKPLPAATSPVQVAGVNTPTPPTPSKPNLGPIGTWSVSEAGSNCRITLSSQVTLDRSRALSTCKTPSLSKVSSWERRGNEVVLFSGEKQTARLFEKGNGQYEGATQSGAPVTMSR
jgi:Protease inhibitor Inh